MLGDNAYLFGTDAEYQAALFEMYPTILRNTVLWPSFGNHDDFSSNSITPCDTEPPPCGPYYQNFTLPTNAEAGGVASNIEAYYSYDYANVHFIVLDSATDALRQPGSQMLTWLQQDLNATSQDWVIAYWHHAPYTVASHHSDTEIALIEMREHVLPILEAVGVDLVLTGHSHSYERSFLIDDFYEMPTTIGDGVVINNGDGNPNGDGAYLKPTVGPAPHEGAVYAVVGSSGGQTGECLPALHPVKLLCLPSTGPSAQPGSLILVVTDTRLDAKFIDAIFFLTMEYTSVRIIPF